VTADDVLDAFDTDKTILLNAVGIYMYYVC